MKRKYSILCAAVLIVLVLGFLGVLFLPRIGQFKAARTEADVRASVAQAEDSERTSGEGYVSPVDFEALREGNPDIYAWLYLPGAEISEPILQREGEDQYYLTHNSVGSADGAGALFTESEYNSRDFSDPATVIYGRNTLAGRLFSDLQSVFSSDSQLMEHNKITVYLPEEEIHYQIFAAVPFRNYHLLHYFSFKNAGRYQMFLDVIDSVRTLDAHRDDSVEVTPEDQLLILSTTRKGSVDISYLVLAKRI